jgi:hypothetical protein
MSMLIQPVKSQSSTITLTRRESRLTETEKFGAPSGIHTAALVSSRRLVAGALGTRIFTAIVLAHQATVARIRNVSVDSRGTVAVVAQGLVSRVLGTDGLSFESTVRWKYLLSLGSNTFTSPSVAADESPSPAHLDDICRLERRSELRRGCCECKGRKDAVKEDLKVD